MEVNVITIVCCFLKENRWALGRNVFRYQQSELDLVRCRHGRNRSVDTVSRDSSKRSLRGVGYRNSDLDLVGTLPKRKQDSR